MSYARPLLDTYPRTVNVDAGLLAATIDTLNDCSQACTADADDDLSEQNLTEMVKCIRLCLDCADVCTATVRVTSRQTEYDANVTKPLLEACVATCKSCGDSASGIPRLRALPHLRRGLPALRASMPGAPGHDQIAGQPFRPVQFKRSRLWGDRARAHRRLTGRTRGFQSHDPVKRHRPGATLVRPPNGRGRSRVRRSSRRPASTPLWHRLPGRRPSAPASPGADDGLGPGGRGCRSAPARPARSRYRYRYALLEVAPMSRLTTVPRGRVPQ